MNLKYWVRPPMIQLRLHYGKPPKASRESSMPTDDQDRHHPYPIPSDSTWVPSPAFAKPDRATYEASRRADLDRIRLIYIKRSQLLGYFCPLGIHEIDHLWDDEDISMDDKEEHNKVESELYLGHRVLVHAVEGYLLGCVEYPVLTAEAALMRTTNTDSLIALLQAEEDLMIRKLGPPWVDQPLTFRGSSLGGLQPPGIGPRAATSGTTAPWCWPWR
jgi:hypothetical protein